MKTMNDEGSTSMIISFITIIFGGIFTWIGAGYVIDKMIGIWNCIQRSNEYSNVCRKSEYYQLVSNGFPNADSARGGFASDCIFHNCCKKKPGKSGVWIMARRYDSNDYPDMSGFSNINGMGTSVLASVIYTILLTIILLAVVLFVGPVADFFVNWLLNDPLNAGNPYVSPAIVVFQWWYIFIFASWVVGVIMIWRAVFFNISYERVN